jgi:radical SAM protein with 4Fe4S-binding SPASM domain
MSHYERPGQTLAVRIVARLRIRKERTGMVVYDRKTRNSEFIAANAIGAAFPETVVDQARQALGIEPLASADVEMTDNGRTSESELSAPVAVYMEITNRCNLHCPHCYKGSTPTGVLPLGRQLEIIDELRELGVFELRLTGYEPVLCRDFEVVANHAKRLGFYLVVNTNGSYPSPYRDRILRGGFDEVIVSLDGTAATHDGVRGKGSFKQATELLQLLRLKAVRTRINMVVNRRNIDEMHYVGALADSLGAYVNFLPLRTGGTPSVLKEQESLNAADMLKIVRNVESLRVQYTTSRFLTYFDILQGAADLYHPMWMCNPCPARKNLYISADGSTFPCDFLSYLGDRFSGGNAGGRTIAEIWASDSGLSRYWNLKRSDRCLACSSLGKSCCGGCASETLATESRYDDPLCFLHLLPPGEGNPIATNLDLYVAT